MTQVDLYTRLSVLKDGSDSIERQELDLRKEAERQGKTVRKVWSDGKSGFKNVKRPDFDKAIAAVTSGEVPELWVWKLDRLSRQGAGKVGTILDDLKKRNGRIFFYKDNLDSTTARQLIILYSEQALAESANTSVRVTAKNDSKLAQGFPVAGKRRYGFLGADPSIGRLGNVEAHPEEAPQVKALFLDYLNGASIRSLAIRMGWTTLRVRETLKNPSYAGWVVRHGTRYPAHESIARLVTQEDFDAVQARLALNSSNGGGGVVKHLASGIATCGVCHRPMIFRNGYMCLHDLSHPWIKESILDKKIQRKVVEVFTDPDFSHDDQTSAVSIYDVNREIAQLEEDIQDVLSGLQNGLKMSQLLPHLKPLQEAQEAAQTRLESLLSESVQARIIQEITSGMRQSAEVWTAKPPGQRTQSFLAALAWNDLSLDHKRELLKSLFTITVNPGRGADRVDIERRKATGE